MITRQGFTPTPTIEYSVHLALWDIFKKSFEYEINIERENAVAAYKLERVKKSLATRRCNLKKKKKA